MNIFQALIMGIVEGLSEFLPISSTGHLIITRAVLNISDDEFVKAFEVIIQSGAMMAVILYYREKLLNLSLGFSKKDKEAQHEVFCVVLAFIPAAILGLTLSSFIKEHLFSLRPVIAALAGGGIAMILIERSRRFIPTHGETQRQMTYREALGIGFFQCLALWPGTSRSMATILGGRIMGLNPKSAAEFSFLLAIPTLLAASLLDLFKIWPLLTHQAELWIPLAVGFVSSFFVALLVIHWFLQFLAKHTLEAFGWYRILFAAVLYYIFFIKN